jgi:hypothetical protein
LLLLVAALLGLTGFSEVSGGQPLIVAGESGRIHPQQDAYIEEIIPGDEREYPIDVTNPSDEEVTALLYAADAIPAIGGGSDFTLPTDPDLGAAAWYTTPDQLITLQPGETQHFLMKMRIPEHVQPGQYVSVIGVFIDPHLSSTKVTGNQDKYLTTMVYKAGVQVVLNYRLAEAKPPEAIPPEAIPHAATYAMENGKAVFSVILINEGDSLSMPQMEVRITRQEGNKQVLAWETAVDSIYAGTAAQVQMKLEQPLRRGAYLAEVKTAVNGHTVRKVLPFDVNQPTALSSQQTTDSEFMDEERRFILSRVYLYGVILLIIITLAVYQKRKNKK